MEVTDYAPVKTILLWHRDYVEGERGTWSKHRDSYMDNFYREKSASGSGTGAKADLDDINDLDTLPLFAVNRMKGWVVSYTASLFYRGFSSELAPDEVYEKDSPVEPATMLVKKLLDRWYTNEPFAQTTETAFTSCLLNPHGGFYLKEDPRPRRPIDKLTVEFMPVWECVWDRFASSIEEARYIGRAWWVPIEDAERMFGCTRERAKGHLCAKPNVPTDGLNNVIQRQGADENYVRILDISYPKAAVVVPGAKGTEPTTVYGKRCVYLLDKGGDPVDTLVEGPMPWQDADGCPLLNVEPIVLTSVPEHPLWGIPNAGTIYALERENNAYASWLAQAFKLEALRKLLWDASKVTAVGNENGMDSMDHAVVQVEPGMLAGGVGAVAAWVPPPPGNSSGIALRQFVEQMFQAVQGTAPVTRGQPTPYIPATESANLSAYSETTLGLLRSKMDRAVASLGKKYLRALAAVLEKEKVLAIPIRFEDEEEDIVPLPVAQLKLRWTVRIVDGANTPAKTEGQKKDALQLAPLLAQLAQYATAQGPEVSPELRVAIRRVWDDIIKRFGMSDGLKWKEISEGAEELAKAAPEMMPAPVAAQPAGIEQPAAPAAPPPVPMNMTLEQMGAAASDEEVEAAMRRDMGAR